MANINLSVWTFWDTLLHVYALFALLPQFFIQLLYWWKQIWVFYEQICSGGPVQSLRACLQNSRCLLTKNLLLIICQNPNLKKIKIKKWPHIFFSEDGAWFFDLIFGCETFPQMSLNFCKVGFPDKLTGLWAFEEHLSYQKYQGPPIVVRWSCSSS